jgi:glucose/arabinose dehydrogenase
MQFLIVQKIGITIAACALAFPSLLHAQGGGAGSFLEWSAYNDTIAGATTHANATRWGVFASTSGALKNITSGANLSASLAITNSGSASAATMAAPNAGSAAALIFSPYVHWNSGTGEAIQISAGNTVTYVFSGLDPSRRYTFRGTSVRGNTTYTNRWTKAEISGTASHVAAHTANILTNAQQPSSITANQAAWNSGNNLVGEIVGWDQINPGVDGTFSIITTRYSGDYPGGNTETPTAAQYGYGFQALRLEQWTNGPPPAPTAVADAATLHAGQKMRIAVLQNDTGSITSTTVAVVQPPAKGTAIPQSDGSIFYTAQAQASGTDSFTYQVSGPGGASNAATVSVTLAANLKIPVAGLNVPSTPPPTAIEVVPAFVGLTFSSPTCLASPPGDTNRLFVCQKGGLLRVIPNVTAPTPTATTFLDLPTLLATRSETVSTSSEQGLLGLAFHPNYATNRYFYVFYSVTRSGVTYERLSRFTTQSGNLNLADAASELVLLEQADDAGNHNGGDLHFGPDGYLYISLGDEGNQNDSLNNSQTITKDFFSTILRIDVDKKPGSLAPNAHAAVIRDAGVARYAVPPDNPFVGATSFNGVAVTPSNVRTEFWAVGMRNPWRMSFDSETGELWVGDVGGGVWEEIDVVTRGGNYGWAYREGAHAGPKSVPVGVTFTSIDPIFEYAHGSGVMQGNSVTGGLVYRGTRIPSLTGAYLFADYTSGNVWTLRRNGVDAPTVTRIAGEVGIVAFGTDPSNKDVLLADFDGNRILRLTATTPAGGYPLTLSATGLFHDLADLTPAPGLLEYDINVPFWSDYAQKRRWFTIPNGTSQMTWSRDGNWIFPTGAVWVKHFDLELTRGNPATRKRLETRLLVKNSTGAYGVT